jgi:hypothetical protein
MENIMMDWWLVSAFQSLVLEIVRHAYSGGRKKSGWKAPMIQKGLFLRAHHVILPPFIVSMSEFDHIQYVYHVSPISGHPQDRF